MFYFLRIAVVAIVFYGLIIITPPQSIDRMLPFPNRLEGKNIRLDELEDFKLLGIHRAFEAFSHRANLTVRFFVPDASRLGGGLSSVFVEAQERQDINHYFMSAKSPLERLAAGAPYEFKPWPTSDVIDVLGIPPGNLAVLAGSRSATHTLYFPIDLSGSSSSPPTSVYSFYFLTGNSLQSIDIRVTDPTGKSVGLDRRQSCNTSIDPDCVLFAAATVMPIELNFSNLKSDEYHVGLIGHMPTTTQVAATGVDIYHRAASER